MIIERRSFKIDQNYIDYICILMMVVSSLFILIFFHTFKWRRMIDVCRVYTAYISLVIYHLPILPHITIAHMYTKIYTYTSHFVYVGHTTKLYQYVCVKIKLYAKLYTNNKYALMFSEKYMRDGF